MRICGQEERYALSLMEEREGLYSGYLFFFEWKNLNLKAEEYGVNQEIWAFPRSIG